MSNDKYTRKDAGAKETPVKKEIVPVVTPTGSTVDFHSTAEQRVLRRKKRLATPPPDVSDSNV